MQTLTVEDEVVETELRAEEGISIGSSICGSSEDNDADITREVQAQAIQASERKKLSVHELTIDIEFSSSFFPFLSSSSNLYNSLNVRLFFPACLLSTRELFSCFKRTKERNWNKTERREHKQSCTDNRNREERRGWKADRKTLRENC